MNRAIDKLDEALRIIGDYKNGYPMASESVAYVATGDIDNIHKLIEDAIQIMRGDDN